MIEIKPITTTTASAVQVFIAPNLSNVRTTIGAEGAVWFVAQDVCKALGLNNTAMALRRVNDAFKGVSMIDTIRGRQRVSVINEAGLYALIMRSDKPEALTWQHWVTGTVLPTIRKHGGYVAGVEKLTASEQEQFYAELRAKLGNALRLHDHKTQHDHWRGGARQEARSLLAAHEVANEAGLPFELVARAARGGVEHAMEGVAL